MKRQLSVTIALSTFAALALSAAVRAADTSDHSADTILKIEHDWIVASQCGDDAYVQALLADDYRDLSYDNPKAKAEVSGKSDGSGHSHAKPEIGRAHV